MGRTSFFWSAVVGLARKLLLCKSMEDSARFGRFSLVRSFITIAILEALFIVMRHIIFATQRHRQVGGSQCFVFRGSGTIKRGFNFGWAEQEEGVIQLWLRGLNLECIEGSKRKGRWFCSNGCLAVCNGCFDVAAEMEYNAQKVASTMSGRMLEDLVSGLDRAALVELLNLEIEWPLVADIKGVHPPTLAAPSSLKINGDFCPFVGAGTSADCCTGSVLARRGHLTVSLPCYRTDVLHDNSVCAHCEELWADKDEEGFYVLRPKLMKNAAEVYKAGKTGVMKKWMEIKGARNIFESEAAAAKDVFADSTEELGVDFPGMGFDQFCKEILNVSGVLFADAGKSRNPYRRTAAQQTNIGQYVQRMSVLWIRVKAAVKPAIFETFVTKLRGIAQRVEQAAKWTLQKAFPNYPVFVGPLVCADIMLAGFLFADQRYEHQLGRVMQNSGEDRDESPIKVGPVLDRMDRWAKTVKAVRLVSPKRRPKASSKAASSTPLWDAAGAAATPVAKNLTSDFDKAGSRKATSTESARGAHPGKSKAGAANASSKSWFYGVGRGFKPGVYTTWNDANKQIKNFSGCRIKKFRSRVGAEKYVKEMQEEPQVVWWVLKNSRADGAYESKGLASLYNTFGTTMVKRHSLSAAKRFLGKSRIKVYREDDEGEGARVDVEAENADNAAASAEVPAAEASTAAATTQVKRQFFACKDSAQDGVYATLKEVLAAVKGGGVFEVFDSEAEAAEYCKPADASPGEADSQEVFVVWSGKKTGVMSAAECVQATAGVHGAEAEGPMLRSKAVALWQEKHKKGGAEDEKAGPGELQHIEYPSDAEWAKVAASKQTRVFACWVETGKGRISFTWDAAAEGSEKDVSVKVFSSESTLFLNFARAEEYLASSTSGMSIKSQIAAARKSVAKKPAPRKKAAAKATEAAAASTGQSVGSRVGLSGVVLTREVTQIRRCFVDAPTAVQLVGAPAEPEEDELERDMPAPGAATYLSQEVEKQVSGSGELTLLEYFSYKKAKLKAWPLKEYDEFLAFCRQGQRLCMGSDKEVGAVNAVFFQKLLDIAVRTHGQMVRRGTLGVNEIRFQVRMYLHLQYATNYKVLHTGASAMRAYEAAVDTFGAAKVPKFRRKSRGVGGDGAGYSGNKFGSGGKKGGSGLKQPVSGCWLCPASDHYASDPQFHPRPADGKRAPLSAEKKKAIVARVDASSLTADEKKAEKASMRKYWAQHSL